LVVALTDRNRRTLAAVARAMVPPGGAVEAGADELDLPNKITRDVDTYPRFAHNQVRLLLFAVEHYPLASGHIRRFSRLPPKRQYAFLDAMAHHKRSALRRLVVSYLKSIVFGAFVSQPETEAVIGYGYECLKPLARPGEQIHH
jgi:hypothetical protein